MFVSMWMTTDVMTTYPQALLADAAALMASRKIRRLPVMQSPNDPTLVGIVSATDVLHASPARLNPFSTAAADGLIATEHLRSDAITVGDVMTRNPLTVTPDMAIETVAALMRERKIGAFPVVRKDELLGLITESDVLRAFASVLQGSSGGARITFDISEGEDVFPLISELVRKHELRVDSLITLHRLDPPMCVVNVAGENIDAMLEDVWKSHHRVEHVHRHE